MTNDSNNVIELFEDGKLWREHEEEAQRRGAEFYNFGKCTCPGEWIFSKTSAGHLTSTISKNGEITHYWEPYPKQTGLQFLASGWG